MIEHLFAGIHVGSRDTAAAWYERLLGRPPDLVPNDREAAWQLREGAWIVLIAGDPQGAPGRELHTLLVDDLEGFLRAASERGVEPGPVEPVGPDMRQSIVTDPDGNRLKIAAPRGSVP